MRYKIIGSLVVLLAVIAAIIVPVISKGTEHRIHQHMEAEKKEPCILENTNGEICTHLPLVIIDTDGLEIPGKQVTEKQEDGTYVTYYTMAENGDKRISATMQVIDGGGYNHAEDPAAVSSDITIRVRGRTSRAFEKSSYALTLVNSDGTNNDQEIMGMDAHHDWVLYGPYLDKTDIRNYMFYNLSGEIMDYAPNVRYCEVILNGEYHGLYVMTESITAGKDGARLPLEVDKKNQTYTGYLVRLDKNPEYIVNASEGKIADSFTGYTYRRSTNLEILYPGASKLTDEMKRSISQDFSDFEKALYSYDYDSDDRGYEKYIDVDSFIDAFLITEITCNYDFGALSTYVYKGVDGKFRICMWDFNNSCDNFKHTAMTPQNFDVAEIVWYFMLVKDEDFTRRVIQRYHMLREGLFADEYLDNYIDSVVAYLGPAIKRDHARWESTYATGHGLLGDEARDPATYEDAVVQLKTFLKKRLLWLDKNIDAISQYSAESKVKKFNSNAN